MNVKRYTARNSRDALKLVREALGVDAVVLSTRPSADGVEVLAMAPGAIEQIERSVPTAAGAKPSPAPAAAPKAQRPALHSVHLPAIAAAAPEAAPARTPARRATQERIEPTLDEAVPVEADVARLTMSTLSFQDYVRERMLRRRQAAIEAKAAAPAANTVSGPADAPAPAPQAQAAVGADATRAPAVASRAAAESGEPPLLREALVESAAPVPAPQSDAAQRWTAAPALADAGAAAPRDPHGLLDEIRAMRGLIEDRFGALAFMEKLQRQPSQARLAQRLLDAGFSPALIRKLSVGLPADVADDDAWAEGVLERNLLTGETERALEDQGGVFALVGATGVGKTTTTAKLAAAFATKHGAASLGLVTLDAYRVAAHEQLRAYGRILGVPVHTAHDRSSLEDLLDLLAAKKMVLIDTAGMAQRDSRTRELLDMLAHRSVKRLLVVNSSAQGETIEDVLHAYRAASCEGVVLSKLDEAVKLGPALDAMIRHKLKVVGVANGQRVPEDWHRLSAHALVQRALRAQTGAAFRLDAGEVSLVFAAPQRAAAGAIAAAFAG
ncbi:MAG TPA: flagellar biosynthesis protein FlhF [Burkholderiaceae bacterium]|nr:flagellar biosynthesis protein FlhF [Burkholderiaceae bacterium]